MDGNHATNATDAVIATLAARQYGVVSRRQLFDLGATSRQIERRVASGRLLPMHRGVFAVGHRASRREARWIAAVPACGEGAVLSHRSAGALPGSRAAHTADPAGGRGRRVEFLWPAPRLSVETDGYDAHSTRHAFQLDRTTTNDLQLAGYTVLRFTHADITRRPRQVAARIRAALG